MTAHFHLEKNILTNYLELFSSYRIEQITKQFLTVLLSESLKPCGPVENRSLAAFKTERVHFIT